VFLGKPAEVEVREDVSQQNQPAIAQSLQQFQRLAGTAQFRSQVQVREQQRVEDCTRHGATIGLRGEYLVNSR